jgi:DNA repair exonuclease SbcCD ATPase subunit
MRQYGLEFIKDLAKDRKIAIQSLGVSFSGFKNDLLIRSSIITRREDRDFVEGLVKSLDDDVAREIESQLTRLTIKSFNWIKNIMIKDERIVVENTNEELINNLQEEIKTFVNDVSRLEHTATAREEQLLRKTEEFIQLEEKHAKLESEIQKDRAFYVTNLDDLKRQLEEKGQALLETENQLESKINQINELEEKNNSMNMEIIEKTSEIARLTDTLNAQSAEAMETWASVYSEQQETHQKKLSELQDGLSTQENRFQESLSKVKQEYEEVMKEKISENTLRFEETINDLNDKLNQEQEKRVSEVRDLNQQINDLKSERTMLKQKGERSDTQITNLLEQNEKLSKEATENKINMESINRELSELKEREASSKFTEKDSQTLTKVQNINEYIEQVLSLSNFAPITILVRMNGEMSLDALAKSVGMDPIVLENQLQPLNQRDLIDIKHDGRVVAKFSSTGEKRREKVW